MRRVAISVVVFVLGVATLPAAAFLYVRFGHLPVAVRDPLFPAEERMARSALHTRVERERATADPTAFDEGTLQPMLQLSPSPSLIPQRSTRELSSREPLSI